MTVFCGKKLRRLCYRMSSATMTSAEFFLKMPVDELREAANDVVEIQKEQRANTGGK